MKWSKESYFKLWINNHNDTKVNMIFAVERTTLKKNMKSVLNQEAKGDLCEDWTQCSIYWTNQGDWRAGHCEFVIYPMGKMTWIEMYEITDFFVKVTFCYARHVCRALYKAALIAYFVHTPATTCNVANYYICTETCFQDPALFEEHCEYWERWLQHCFHDKWSSCFVN